MSWIVYDKTGLTERCTVKELEYNGAFMDERVVSCTLESPSMIDFAIGDYLTYKGEKFYLDYDPTQIKNAPFNTVKNAFEFTLTFRTIDTELQNCQFLDYVPYGNDYHYQPSPSFSFVGTAKTFAERIQANMDRDFPGWKILVYEGVETEDKEIKIDNTSCWNALVMINKEYSLNFTRTGRTVKIGYPEETINHTFYYGKDNGLYKITRNVNSDEAIVTRLYAYGGDRNIPKNYNKRESDFSGKKNLMLPGYLTTGKSYIESDNISVYGVREYVKSFEDIYPSIAGAELPGIGRIDELVSSEQITGETETSGTFKVTIKNIGFNIKDYLTTEKATMSIKSGSLIGYEFEIVDVVQLENGNYQVTLNKSTRDDFKVPNAGQNLSTGDRFVLLNIAMPEKYVEYAEEKLLNAAVSFLAEHDHVIYTYDIGVDEIYMARHVDVQGLIKEGMKLPVYDSDLGIDYSIIIQSLSIKDDGNVPVYEISLSEKPIAGTIDKIWEAIDNVKNQGTIYIGGTSTGGGGTSPEELNRKYLRKDVDDTAKGNIYLERNIGSSIYLDGWDGKGWRITNDGIGEMEGMRVRSDIYMGGRVGSPSFASGFTGWGWEIDTPTASGTVDNWTVRKSMKVYEMVYSQIYGLNSSFLVSDWNKIKEVSPLGTSRYRITIDKEDNMLMNLRKGDIVRTQVRENGGWNTRYYAALVENVTDETFDLKILEGTDVPIAGDYVQRIGSDIDKNRHGLIYFTSSDDYAPYIDILDNVTGPQFTQDNTKVRIGNLRGITINGKPLDMHGIYINGGIFQHSTYYTDDGNTIEQRFEIMDGKLDSSIEEIRKDLSEESGNILRNSSFSSDLNYWEINPVVHFINASDGFLWLPSEFYVDKEQVADIYRDGNRNVLRIRNSVISQPNGIMNVPEHESEEDLKTYSFSLYYKVLRPGTYEFGIPGTELYASGQMDAGDTYQKLSKVGKWNGKGDFKVRFTGEILIYGLNMFSDAMADAIIKLETQIEQTSEHIKLLATKEYVDGETGKIYIKYDGELKVTAEQISAINTKTDNINNTIESSGWINTAQGQQLFAKKEMEDGDTIVSSINISPGTIKISADKIDLVGRVTFSMFNSSLQNTINNKVDPSDLGDLAYADYITKGMMSTALQSELNGKVSESALGSLAYASSISKNNLAQSLLTEFNGKANSSSLKALAYLDKVEEAQLGATIISGGHIVTSLIDTDTIYANQAYVGGFSIVSGNLIGSGGRYKTTLSKNGVYIEDIIFDRNIRIGMNSNALTKEAMLEITAAFADVGNWGAKIGGGVWLTNSKLLIDSTSNKGAIEINIGSSANGDNNTEWLVCGHSTGYGSEFVVGSRYFGDSSSMDRTVIKVGKIMTSEHVKRLTSRPNFIPVYYDDSTGYLCAYL